MSLVLPSSAVPVTSGRVFANVHVGAGANSKEDEGLGVEASLGADAIWRLRFIMPPTLPTGTAKLRLLTLANATSGVARVNPKWASVAVEESPSGATLNAEGVVSVTWAAGDNDQYKETKITLDADTVVASEVIAMDLTFETASFTLAQVSTWIPMVIFE